MNRITDEDERAIPITITIKQKYLKKIDNNRVTKEGKISRSTWISNKLEKVLDEIIEPEPVEAVLPSKEEGNIG